VPRVLVERLAFALRSPMLWPELKLQQLLGRQLVPWHQLFLALQFELKLGLEPVLQLELVLRLELGLVLVLVPELAPRLRLEPKLVP
jgi:hypothetical protein